MTTKFNVGETVYLLEGLKTLNLHIIKALIVGIQIDERKTISYNIKTNGTINRGEWCLHRAIEDAKTFAIISTKEHCEALMKEVLNKFKGEI